MALIGELRAAVSFDVTGSAEPFQIAQRVVVPVPVLVVNIHPARLATGYAGCRWTGFPRMVMRRHAASVLLHGRRLVLLPVECSLRHSTPCIAIDPA